MLPVQTVDKPKPAVFYVKKVKEKEGWLSEKKYRTSRGDERIHTAVSHQQASHSFVQNQIELGNAKSIFSVNHRRLSPDGKRYALRDFP